MTFSCFFKTTTTANWVNEWILYCKRNGTFTFQITMRWLLSTNKIYVTDWGVTWTNLWSTNAINDWIWHQLWFIMRNNTTAELYIDWTLNSSSSAFSFITQSFTNWNLLWDFNTWWRAWDGSIDEVIIENRAWSANEMKKYYTYAKWFY
jgi:hypothetical protein